MPTHSTTFKKLDTYLRSQMRMSHIYQPVMLLELLQNKGRASAREIAKALLIRDSSQIEYYEQITRNMVGKVLTKNRGLTERTEDNHYILKGFGELSSAEIAELKLLCVQKLEEYIGRRGESIWEHRTKSIGYISGTIRYEVLKAAKFKCELCGISADEKALEVDHIIPRNKGGSDDITNFQALCYSCNAMKRDRDDTDFRGIVESYGARAAGCPFCEMDRDRVIAENEVCYAIRDGFPVSKYHSLIIPKRHVIEYFDLYRPELNAINSLATEVVAKTKAIDPSVTAFNIGVNIGSDAGQTIMHCHVHLIPRRKNDVANPRGGVRGVIPGKADY